MGRGQPTSRNGGATPASSLIIFLEQRVAELEAERDEWVKDNVKLEARITELEARERQKPAYHCPKCDSWFSENDVAKQ